MHTQIDTAGVLLKKSWEFYKKHYKDLARLILAYLAVVIVFLIVVIGVSVLFTPIAHESSFKILSAFVGQIITLCFTAFFILTLPKFLHELDGGTRPSIKHIFKSIKPHFKEVLIVVILMKALVSGGLIALIVPGIYFALGTIFYSFTISLEGKRGLNALITSYWETNGKKWKIFWRLLLIGLAILVFIMVVSIVFSLLVLTMLALPAVFKFTGLTIIGLALALFTFFGIAPFSFIPQYMIYKSVKAHSTPVDHTFYERKKKMFKIFIGIGLVVWVLSIIFSAFAPEKPEHMMFDHVISKEPKIYVNDRFSYSVNYPGHYVTRSDEESNLAVFASLKNKEESFFVAAFEDKENDNLLDKLTNYLKKDPGVKGLHISDPVDVSLTGDQAKRVDISYEDKEKVKMTLVYTKLSDNWVFALSHYCELACDDEGFDSIIKNFTIK